jgi:hypothetical protein
MSPLENIFETLKVKMFWMNVGNLFMKTGSVIFYIKNQFNGNFKEWE